MELKYVGRPLCVCAVGGRSHCNATVTPGSLRMERWVCGIGASDVPTTLMKFLVSQVSSTLTVGFLSSALLSSKHKFIRTISAGICPLPHYDVNLNCLFYKKKKKKRKKRKEKKEKKKKQRETQSGFCVQETPW